MYHYRTEYPPTQLTIEVSCYRIGRRRKSLSDETIMCSMKGRSGSVGEHAHAEGKMKKSGNLRIERRKPLFVFMILCFWGLFKV